MATQTAPPILDFSPVITRERVRMPDGKTYEIKSPDEVPWMFYRGHSKRYERVGALMQVPSRTADEEDELDTLTQSLVREVVMDLPQAVADQLTADQRLVLIAVFSLLLLTSKTAGQRARMAAASIANAAQTTGRKSRAGAPGSSAARRHTGSGKRR